MRDGCLPMTEKEMDRTPRGEAENTLKEYGLLEKQLRASRYEREFFGRKTSGEEAFLQAKQYAIRKRIYDLPNCPEKLFLDLHYLRGHSVEKCAELMDISRRTAFRLKNRAIDLFSAHKSEERQATFI